MMDDYKNSDNFQRTEGCKMISPHHSHPTNGVRPSDSGVGEWLNVGMLELRVETTWTTGKNNFIKVRGLTRPRFSLLIYLLNRNSEGVHGRVRPCVKVEVVSNKLFPKSEDSEVNRNSNSTNR